MSLRDILQELRSWRDAPSHRDRIRSRPLDKEVPDPTPVAVPVGYEHPPTMTELIQRYVRLEVSQAASADGLGTFQEEDDFSVDEIDPLPMTAYAVNEFPMEPDPEMPPTSPVEDPPSEDPEGVAEPPESEATEPPAATQ